MRLIIMMLIAASPAALAHTPDETTLVSLAHNLVSPHHLPFALIAVAAMVLLIRLRVIRERARRDR